MKKLSSLLVSASIVYTLQGYAADMHWGYTGVGSGHNAFQADSSTATP